MRSFERSRHSVATFIRVSAGWVDLPPDNAVVTTKKFVVSTPKFTQARKIKGMSEVVNCNDEETKDSHSVR
ncbi:MAG: hypothetical protein WAV67_09330, partial [Dokdonella sp.]